MVREEQMKCGGCGCETVTVKASLCEHRHDLVGITLTCTKCKSTTVIAPSRPKLQTEWAGEGGFCAGWGE